MWMAVSAEPQWTSLHLSQWTHTGQRHMCGASHSHAVSYLWVKRHTLKHAEHTQWHRNHSIWLKNSRHLQLLPVAPAWSSVWMVAAVSWMLTSSPSVAASRIMEEIDARLTSAETTARMEEHAHLLPQVRYGHCKLFLAFSFIVRLLVQ